MADAKSEVASKAQQALVEQLEKDEKKLDQQVTKAQLLSTPVPPKEQWKICWACGKPVPMLTRDPMDGVLVCRTCYAIAQVASTVEDIGDVLEAVSDMLVQVPVVGELPEEEEPEDDTEPDDETEPDTDQGEGEEA